jgi:hypothetical protein
MAEDGRTNIPSWRAVEGFCDVVVAFTVSAHKEDFVINIARCCPVESKDLSCKLLPLGQVGRGTATRVNRISAVDEAKVGSCLKMLLGFIHHQKERRAHIIKCGCVG